MSLRSRVRDLEGRRAHHLERLNRLARDVSELFRRTDADFDLHGQQTKINRALDASLAAAREETLSSVRTLDEAIGTLHERIRALEASEDALYPAEAEAALEVAVVGGQVVTFKYRDREGESSYRVVSPYELQEKPVRRRVSDSRLTPVTFLSLLGWDHGREGIRHFRVERIEGAVTATNVETYRPPREETP